ncbi:acetolactate synthase small subunit [Anaerophilus nitritogenes]|uniref:acetolactate synthase small subunit n=1 Tax=Anaerophilus nitritogenes TaxID=2498136 RepID=UPI00101CF55E|nr:acetolactate synthase small subunit [Anaerophilus nitritogenes]
MEKHILSILVENHSSVLSRITGLFSRRCFNISSLSVGETQDPKHSRITIETYGDEFIIGQIQKQLDNLVDVIKIIELKPCNSVYRETNLIKVRADSTARAEIIDTVKIFRGSIIDVSQESLVIEILGEKDKNNAFIELMKPYGILELVRTGITGLERGIKTLKDYKDY